MHLLFWGFLFKQWDVQSQYRCRCKQPNHFINKYYNQSKYSFAFDNYFIAQLFDYRPIEYEMQCMWQYNLLDG
jgi:hypothetical protein